MLRQVTIPIVEARLVAVPLGVARLVGVAQQVLGKRNAIKVGSKPLNPYPTMTYRLTFS